MGRGSGNAAISRFLGLSYLALLLRPPASPVRASGFVAEGRGAMPQAERNAISPVIRRLRPAGVPVRFRDGLRYHGAKATRGPPPQWLFYPVPGSIDF